ncbi:MAG: DUF3147 family protein [Thermodesulfobacteriota bacterium]
MNRWIVNRMIYYIIKLAITAILIVLISEISKRSSLIGGMIASIPIVSVLALTWLYIDTNDTEKISGLSISIFWFVIPSLALFISLPILLRKGINYYISILISIILTVVCYYITLILLNKFGFKP